MSQCLTAAIVCGRVLPPHPGPLPWGEGDGALVASPSLLDFRLPFCFGDGFLNFNDLTF